MSDPVSWTPASLAHAISALKVGEVQACVPMKDHTTMRVGGPVDVFVTVERRDGLRTLVRYLREHKVPWLVLGNGSNLLVKEGGLEGVVISLKRLDRLDVLDAEAGRIFVEAGVPITRLVRSGLELALDQIWILGGIPGTLGGAIRMNAGTRYGEIQQVVESIELVSGAGVQKTVPRAELKFGYRTLELPKDRLVVGATLVFGRGDAETIRARHKEVMGYRSDTQPLTLPSVGSVFRNPPPKTDGDVVAAGKLIELSGLKGVRVRGAQISEKHANWIVNVGNATCTDVLALVRLIKDKVKQDHGVQLELEAKVVGRDVQSERTGG